MSIGRVSCSRPPLLVVPSALHFAGLSSSWTGTTPRILPFASRLLTFHYSLTPTEQRELNSRMESRQMKEFMTVSHSSHNPACVGPLTYTTFSTDVLQTCSAMLRALCQRFHNKVSEFAGGRLCDEMCGQVSQGIGATGPAISRAERSCNVTRPGQIRFNLFQSNGRKHPVHYEKGRVKELAFGSNGAARRIWRFDTSTGPWAWKWPRPNKHMCSTQSFPTRRWPSSKRNARPPDAGRTIAHLALYLRRYGEAREENGPDTRRHEP